MRASGDEAPPKQTHHARGQPLQTSQFAFLAGKEGKPGKEEKKGVLPIFKEEKTIMAQVVQCGVDNGSVKK